MRKYFDEAEFIGKKSGRLTALEVVKVEGERRKKLRCVCECGNEAFVFPYQFSKTKVQSCGCARFGHGESRVGNHYARKHGMRGNRFYKKWNDMVRRCHNPNEPAYKFYGALGIEVCEEWRNTPEKFIEWCEKTHPNEPKMTLDRIDGSKGYFPENCRWITQQEQVHNLKNNRFVTINGETRCITEWCRIYNVSAGSVYKKVHKGMDYAEAILSAVACKKTAAK